MIQAPVAALPVAPAGAGGTSGGTASPLFLAALGRALAGGVQAGDAALPAAGGLLEAMLGAEAEQSPLPTGDAPPEGEAADPAITAFLAAMVPFMGQDGKAGVVRADGDPAAGRPAGRVAGGNSLPLAQAEFAGLGWDDAAPGHPDAGGRADEPVQILLRGMDKDGQTGPVFLRLLPGADALPEAAAPAAHAVNTPLHQPAALPAVTSPQVPVDRTVLPMQTPLGMPGWQQEFADKLVWMSGRQGQVAELILNPPALGSVEVRLNLSGGEAGAQFYSPHAAVRDAIEAALPRLRDMMAEAGLALGEAMVSNQPFQHRNPGQAAGQAAPGHDTVGAAEQHLEGARSYRLGAGLVDYYA